MLVQIWGLAWRTAVQADVRWAGDRIICSRVNILSTESSVQWGEGWVQLCKEPLHVYNSWSRCAKDTEHENKGSSWFCYSSALLWVKLWRYNLLLWSFCDFIFIAQRIYSKNFCCSVTVWLFWDVDMLKQRKGGLPTDTKSSGEPNTALIKVTQKTQTAYDVWNPLLNTQM